MLLSASVAECFWDSALSMASAHNLLVSTGMALFQEYVSVHHTWKPLNIFCQTYTKNNGICFVKAYSSKKKKSYFHYKATAKQIPAISTDFIICVMEAREHRSPFNMLKHCCTRELLRAKWWKKHLILTDWTRSPGGRLGAAQTAQKVQLQRFCTDLQCHYSCKFPVQKWTPEPPGDEELLQTPGSCILRAGLMLGGEKFPYVTQHSISVINAWG